MKLDLPFPARWLTTPRVRRRIECRLERNASLEHINLWLMFSDPWRVVVYGLTRIVLYALAVVLAVVGWYVLTVMVFCL